MMKRLEHRISIRLCGAVLRFESEVPLQTTEGIMRFRTDAAPDVTVPVRIGRMPLPPSRLGGDIMLDYAMADGFRYAAAVMGDRPSSIVTVYHPDFSDVTVWLNTADFGPYILQWSKVLQHFPIREFLLRYDALILHSSRIELGGQAILFSAPSGTGKTTQASLWEKHAGARIVSNDRSILRKTADGVMTSGYPVDGSSPVFSQEEIPLRAAVILRQGPDNRAERLTVYRAMKYLMEQTMLDLWNAEELAGMQLLWADILTSVPAFLLTCTPDERAVICLKEALRKEGSGLVGNSRQTDGAGVQRTDADHGRF